MMAKCTSPPRVTQRNAGIHRESELSLDDNFCKRLIVREQQIEVENKREEALSEHTRPDPTSIAIFLPHGLQR